MIPLRLIAVLTVGLASIPFAAAQDPAAKKDDFPKRPLEDQRDLTLLRRVTEDTFVHELARVSFTVPKGWKEIRPHRLERKIDPKISTVLGIERADRELVASLYWIPMSHGQHLSHWVRDNVQGTEYGEEYETLKTVYGKDRVSLPVRFKSGPFDVYKIDIAGGPDKADKYDGVLYLFTVESGGTNWLIKARISFPKADRARSEAWAQEVLAGFEKMAERSEGRKPVTEIDTEKR